MRELAAYLAEFEAGAGNGPVRFGAAAPASPAPVITTSATPRPSVTVPTLPADALRVGAPLAAGVAWPTLAAGSTALRPSFAVTANPALGTVAGWTAEMRAAESSADALFAAANALEARGREEDQGSGGAPGRDYITPDGLRVPYQPRYSVRKMPASSVLGACDLSVLVWTELWIKAQGVLLRMAHRPPSGTRGADVAKWGRYVRSLRDLLYRSSNLRGAFFFLGWSAVTTGGTRAKVSLTKGLPSDNESRGSYTRDPRAASANVLRAMDFAPQPTGGYAEVMGRDLKQSWEWEATFSKSLRDTPRSGSSETAGGLLPSTALVDAPALAAPTAPRAENRVSYALNGTRGVGEADIARLIDSYWISGDAVRNAAEGVLIGAPRSGSIGSVNWTESVRFSAANWIDNTVAQAAYFGDGLFNLATISLRCTGFYLNSYLAYAAEFGLVPREDLRAAQGTVSSIRTAAQADANMALNVAQVTLSIVGTVAAMVPVVGWIIGVVAALVAGLLEILRATGTLAYGGGLSLSPVLPLYRRVFAGLCEEQSWVVSAPPEAVAEAPGGGDGVPPAPPVTGGGAGVALGVAGLGLGLWLLLSGAKSR